MKHKKNTGRSKISAAQYRSTENVGKSFCLVFENINYQIKSCSINYKTSIYFGVKNFNRIP